MRGLRACATLSVVACLLPLSAVLTVVTPATLGPNPAPRRAPSAAPSGTDLSGLPHTVREGGDNFGKTRSTPPSLSEPVKGEGGRGEHPGENWKQVVLTGDGTITPTSAGTSRKTRGGNSPPEKGNSQLEKGKSQPHIPLNGTGRGVKNSGTGSTMGHLSVQTDSPSPSHFSKTSPAFSDDRNTINYNVSSNNQYNSSINNSTQITNSKHGPQAAGESATATARTGKPKVLAQPEQFGHTGLDGMVNDAPGIVSKSQDQPGPSGSINSSDKKKSSVSISPSTHWQEDVQLGCRELRARRYITDGFCTSEEPIKEVVCAGNCLPIKNIPWYAEFIKTMAKSKLREWQCVEDNTKRKRVKLLCKDGQIRTYKIKVVRSCKCVRGNGRSNRTTPEEKRRRKRKRRRKGRNNRTNRDKKKRKRRRRKRKKNTNRTKGKRQRDGEKRNRSRNSDKSSSRISKNAPTPGKS